MAKGVYEREKPAPLTEQDNEYAKLLLEWSRSLDKKLTTWEAYYNDSLE